MFMRVAISGTPGTGKTTVCGLLSADHDIVDINRVVESEGLHSGMDEERGSLEVDLDALSGHISALDIEGTVLFDGHLSHMLDVDMVIVLRCRPDVLMERLERKGWGERKVKENVQAEILDVIKVEAMEGCEEVYEVDTTEADPASVADSIREAISGTYGQVDISWHEEFEKYLF